MVGENKRFYNGFNVVSARFFKTGFDTGFPSDQPKFAVRPNKWVPCDLLQIYSSGSTLQSMDVAMYPWIRQIFAALPAHCYCHTRFTSSPLGSISPKNIYIRCEKSYNPYIQMNLMKVNYALKM